MQRQLSNHVAIEADYIGSIGRNAYRQNNVNRYSGDLLDGVYNGIMPGFAAVSYTDSSDQSSFNGATFAFKVNRGDLINYRFFGPNSLPGEEYAAINRWGYESRPCLAAVTQRFRV